MSEQGPRRDGSPAGRAVAVLDRPRPPLPDRHTATPSGGRLRAATPSRQRRRPWGRPPSVGGAAWLLAAYVALLPVQIPVTDEVRLAPADLFLLLYLAVRGTRLTADRRDWTGWHALLIAVLAGGSLVGQLNGYFNEQILIQKVFGMVFVLVGVLCLLEYFRDAERIRWLLRILCGWTAAHAGVFMGVMLLQNQGVVDQPDVNMGGARLSGLLVDPNAFGGLLLVALVLVVGLRGRLALFSPAVTRLVGATLAAGLLFTFSRSAWTGLVFALAAGVAIQPRRTWAVVRGAAPLVVIGATVVALTVLPFVLEFAARPDQVEGRFQIIEESIGDVATSPVVGIGMGGAYERHGRIVHNTVLFFLTEFGLVGLVVITGLLGAHAVRAWQATQRLGPQHRQLPATLAVAHAGMFGVSMGIEALYQRHWWLVMAGIMAVHRIALDTAPAPAVPLRPRPDRRAAPALAELATRPAPAVAPPTAASTEMAPAEAAPEPLVAARRGRVAPPAPPAEVGVADTPAGHTLAPVAHEVPAAAAAERGDSADTDASGGGGLLGSLRRRWRGETVNHATWGVIDQGASSATNFIVTLVVAGAVSVEDFGAFSFAFVLYVVAIGTWRSLNSEPLMMRYSAHPDQLPGAGARSLGSTWMVGALAGLLLVVVGHLSPHPYRPMLQMLGIALPLLLVQDTARLIGFAMLRSRTAAINDTAWGVILLAALGAIVVGVTDPPGWVFLAAWGISGMAAGLLILGQLRITPVFSSDRAGLVEYLRLGVPLWTSYVLTACPPYLLFLLMPAVGGLAELGVLRAGYLPFGPFGVLLQSVPILALPIALRLASRRAVVRMAWRLSLAMVAVAALWGLVVTVVIPDAFGTWLMGDLWELSYRTRVLFAFAVVVEAATSGPLLTLRAFKVPGRLVRVRLVTGPLTLLGGFTLMSAYGAEGAAAAFLVAHVVTLALGWMQVRSALRAGGDGSPELIDATTGRQAE